MTYNVMRRLNKMKSYSDVLFTSSSLEFTSDGTDNSTYSKYSTYSTTTYITSYSDSSSTHYYSCDSDYTSSCDIFSVCESDLEIEDIYDELDHVIDVISNDNTNNTPMSSLMSTSIASIHNITHSLNNSCNDIVHFANHESKSITDSITKSLNEVSGIIYDDISYCKQYMNACVNYSDICTDYYRDILTRTLITGDNKNILLLGLTMFDEFLKMNDIISGCHLVCIDSDINKIKKAKHSIIDNGLDDVLDCKFIHTGDTYESNNESLIKLINLNNDIKIVYKRFDLIIYDINIPNILSIFKLYTSHCSELTSNVVFGFMYDNYSSYAKYMNNYVLKSDMLDNINACNGRVYRVGVHNKCDVVSKIEWRY